MFEGDAVDVEEDRHRGPDEMMCQFRTAAPVSSQSGRAGTRVARAVSATIRTTAIARANGRIMRLEIIRKRSFWFVRRPVESRTPLGERSCRS